MEEQNKTMLNEGDWKKILVDIFKGDKEESKK